MSEALEALYGRVTGVYRKTAGHVLTIDAPIGATVLTTDDTADFDEAGGQVMVSGIVYDYESIDPDADTITLATALTVAAVIDDPVDVFDELGGGALSVGYEADVILDDADPTDRPVQVDVNHGLVPMLVESIRGGAAENVTLIRDGDNDWTLWQVDGKLATELAADEAAQAAATAADLALEALTAAELAEAITDGYIDYYYQTSRPWANGSTAHDDDFGDVWVDTDSNPQVAERWKNTRTWVAINDGSLVQALFDAQNAQVTADGKIKHYVGTSFPSGGTYSYGDIFTKTNEDNTEYYWDGNSWEQLLVGNEAIADTLTAKLIRTASSGERVEISDGGMSGDLRFIGSDGTITAAFFPYLSSGVRGLTILNKDGLMKLRIVDTGTAPHVDVFGGLGVSGNLYLTSGSINDVSAINGGPSLNHGPTLNGGPTVNGGLTVNGMGTTGLAANVRISGSGELVESTSSRRYKRNIKNARLKLEAFKGLARRSWQSRCPGDGPRRMVGFIAEEVHDAGLVELVTYDNDGKPKALAYSTMVTHLHAWCEELETAKKQQADEIKDLRARLDRLERKGT